MFNIIKLLKTVDKKLQNIICDELDNMCTKMQKGEKTMRDVNRIYKFCNELAEIWLTQCPDMRFGQMICNVIGDWQSKNKRDIFFIEEDEMMQIFRNYFKVEK